MYSVVVLLHVLAGFAFVLAHGASAAVGLALRRERNGPRIKALLELSASTYGVMFISLLVLLVAGVVAGFMGEWWSHGWIWVSLVLLIAVSAVMGALGARFYSQLRRAVGMEWREGRITHPPEAPVSQAELEALMAREPSALLTGIGLAGLAIIIGLMTLKPF